MNKLLLIIGAEWRIWTIIVLNIFYFHLEFYNFLKTNVSSGSISNNKKCYLQRRQLVRKTAIFTATLCNEIDRSKKI